METVSFPYPASRPTGQVKHHAHDPAQPVRILPEDFQTLSEVVSETALFSWDDSYVRPGILLADKRFFCFVQKVGRAFKM